MIILNEMLIVSIHPMLNIDEHSYEYHYYCYYYYYDYDYTAVVLVVDDPSYDRYSVEMRVGYY